MKHKLINDPRIAKIADDAYNINIHHLEFQRLVKLYYEVHAQGNDIGAFDSSEVARHERELQSASARLLVQFNRFLGIVDIARSHASLTELSKNTLKTES